MKKLLMIVLMALIALSTPVAQAHSARKVVGYGVAGVSGAAALNNAYQMYANAKLRTQKEYAKTALLATIAVLAGYVGYSDAKQAAGSGTVSSTDPVTPPAVADDAGKKPEDALDTPGAGSGGKEGETVDGDASEEEGDEALGTPGARTSGKGRKPLTKSSKGGKPKPSTDKEDDYETLGTPNPKKKGKPTEITVSDASDSEEDKDDEKDESDEDTGEIDGVIKRMKAAKQAFKPSLEKFEKLKETDQDAINAAGKYLMHELQQVIAKTDSLEITIKGKTINIGTLKGNDIEVLARHFGVQPMAMAVLQSKIVKAQITIVNKLNKKMFDILKSRGVPVSMSGGGY